MSGLRVGQGLDIHRLVKGRPLILGGVTIPSPLGLDGHSDADVLLHALMDALLGAAGKGDIGTRFPPSDERWRGADSLQLLKSVWAELSAEGYVVCNIDCSVVAEAPKLNPHIGAMKRAIAGVLQIAEHQCGIKATTAEKLGALGAGEGIAASVVVLVEQR